MTVSLPSAKMLMSSDMLFREGLIDPGTIDAANYLQENDATYHIKFESIQDQKGWL